MMTFYLWFHGFICFEVFTSRLWGRSNTVFFAYLFKGVEASKSRVFQISCEDRCLGTPHESSAFRGFSKTRDSLPQTWHVHLVLNLEIKKRWNPLQGLHRSMWDESGCLEILVQHLIWCKPRWALNDLVVWVLLGEHAFLCNTVHGRNPKQPPGM